MMGHMGTETPWFMPLAGRVIRTKAALEAADPFPCSWRAREGPSADSAPEAS